MIDLDANILLPDGNTIKAEKIKTDMQLADEASDCKAEKSYKRKRISDVGI